MPLDTIEDNIMALIRVQTADTEADNLIKTRQMAVDTMDLSEARLKAFIKQSEDEKKALIDLQKQQKTMEIEVGTLDTKVTRYQTQLLEVKSNKDYDALKLEIENGKAEKARIEDRILEGLFRQDEQKKKIEAILKQIEEDRKRSAEEKKTLQVKISDCDSRVETVRKDRERVLAEIDTEWSEAYNQLRKSGKKVAVAEITEEKMCSGCRMSVPPQTTIEVRRALQVIRCSCGRILYVKD